MKGPNYFSAIFLEIFQGLPLRSLRHGQHLEFLDLQGLTGNNLNYACIFYNVGTLEKFQLYSLKEVFDRELVVFW